VNRAFLGRKRRFFNEQFGLEAPSPSRRFSSIRLCIQALPIIVANPFHVPIGRSSKATYQNFLLRYFGKVVATLSSSARVRAERAQLKPFGASTHWNSSQNGAVFLLPGLGQCPATLFYIGLSGKKP